MYVRGSMVYNVDTMVTQSVSECHKVSKWCGIVEKILVTSGVGGKSEGDSQLTSSMLLRDFLKFQITKSGRPFSSYPISQRVSERSWPCNI